MKYIDDEIYKRLSKKFEDGTFTKGDRYNLRQYHFHNQTIKDLPENLRTREFFISAYPANDVVDYIQKHISDFDRQFFKDLIVSNEYAIKFNQHCFSIMPLEYIDEEMCSLAMLYSTDWMSAAWFYFVYEKKPEVLTEDLWKLGARLYVSAENGENTFLEITPENYKDNEYYKEMCSCHEDFFSPFAIDKREVMTSIPEEILTPEFLLNLLLDDMDNIVVFNEQALETEISYTDDGKEISEKIWQFAIRKRGNTISHIELNNERIEYFLNLYDEDSNEYRYSFPKNPIRYRYSFEIINRNLNKRKIYV